MKSRSQEFNDYVGSDNQLVSFKTTFTLWKDLLEIPNFMNTFLIVCTCNSIFNLYNLQYD